MPYAPVSTKADLDSLDPAEVLEGYLSAEQGDPEPGPNRGRAFWHGWCNRMRDKRQLPMTEAQRQLTREIIFTLK
jgi:hypothetical protein